MGPPLSMKLRTIWLTTISVLFSGSRAACPNYADYSQVRMGNSSQTYFHVRSPQGSSWPILVWTLGLAIHEAGSNLSYIYEQGCWSEPLLKLTINKPERWLDRHTGNERINKGPWCRKVIRKHVSEHTWCVLQQVIRSILAYRVAYPDTTVKYYDKAFISASKLTLFLTVNPGWKSCFHNYWGASVCSSLYTLLLSLRLA
jgi:hypothetical protein